jgi:MFS family permease
MAAEELLERERRAARPAAAGAVLGAVLPMAGAIAGARVLSDQPRDSASKLLYFHDHSGSLIAYAILLALGALAILVPMRFLYGATRARRPGLPRVALICLVFGCVVLAVVQVTSQVVLAEKASAFATSGNQTYEEAKAVFELPVLRGLAAAGLAAQLSLGFAFVMISLNAMRVGLLSRFMGVIGIIVGVLFVVPLAPGPPVVQSFWLGALAVLFAGRWPGGVPPAWSRGEAVPWPSQQELRERRQRGRPQGAPAPEPEPAAAGGPTATRPHPASKKRKRKKRR